MDRARWLAAVSGGNYAATSWTLARVGDRSGHAAADVIDWLNSPIRYSKSPQHRFLRNGPGGLGRSILAAAVLRRLQRRRARRPRRRPGLARRPADREQGDPGGNSGPSGHSCRNSTVPPELWLPAASLLVLAGIVLLDLGAAVVGDVVVVAGGCRARRDRRRRRVGHRRVPVADGRTSEAGCAAGTTPAEPRSRAPRRCSAPSERCGGSCASRCSSRFAQKLPYLGGVLLAIAAFIWAGKVATDAATGEGLLSTSTRWALVVIAFVAVYLFVGMTNLSIHNIYRQRLRRSFGVRRDAEGRLYSPHRARPDDVGPAAGHDAGAARLLRPRARRHRPRRSARRHVHDLAARGVHRRSCHVDRALPRAAARRPAVRTCRRRRGWRRPAPPSPRRWAACRGGRRTR